MEPVTAPVVSPALEFPVEVVPALDSAAAQDSVVPELVVLVLVDPALADRAADAEVAEAKPRSASANIVFIPNNSTEPVRPVTLHQQQSLTFLIRISIPSLSFRGVHQTIRTTQSLLSA
jgi:hypothetical protein